MTIDIEAESLIPVSALPAELPNRPHISTVWRWIRRGCRGIKLETAQIGGRTFTSREAKNRFVERTTAAARGDTQPISSMRRTRDRAVRQANKDLDQEGI